MTRFLKNFGSRLQVEGRHIVTCFPATVFHAARCGSLPLKDRHVYTRQGRLRLRYVAVMVLGFMSLASTNFVMTPMGSFDMAVARANVADFALDADDGLASPAVAMVQPQQWQTQPQAAPAPAPAPALAAAPISPSKPALPTLADYTRTLTIKAGDTLSDIFEYAALDAAEASSAIDALKPHIDPRALKTGQDVKVNYRWTQAQGERLTSVEFAPDALTRVVLRQGVNGAFKVDKIQKPLLRETRAARARIHSSLYADLRAAGVPDSIIADFIKAYSFSVDFQRDIWAGDMVEILYDVDRTDDGDFVRGNGLKYAALIQRGKANVIYRYDHDGQSEYFDGKGSPIKKALLRTPVDGARVTSGFGMRRHPIQGYSKMHKGVDFGAPTGTPIFAAGDGIISRASWFGGYGNYVSIKHNGMYSSAYGHMSQINVRPGQRVRQGQVIGRVGTTGNSTGPHLHFEIIKDGAPVNPINVANMAIGNNLGGKQLARFQQAAASSRGSFNQLISGATTPKLVSATGQ